MNDDSFYRRALQVTPKGSQTLSKRPAALPFVGSHYADRGHGALVFNRNGQRFIDWIGALGANVLGYNHPTITQAVIRQIYKGSVFSLPHELEVTVAERLTKVIPGAEQIRFVKTGSEACSAAISIARAATRRTKILTDNIGYHGWHDQFRVLAPTHPGVPDDLHDLIGTFTYGNIDNLHTELLTSHEPVAAVIMEPARLNTPPYPEYLSEVLAAVHDAGALLIFDEMILGGRHALAGGSEYFGVTPDLSTYGKAFGAGYPLAFVAGRSELMEFAWPISGTFSGDAIALAACDAMLDVYQTTDVVGDLWRNGGALKSVADASDVVRTEGYAPHFAMKMLHHDQRLGMSLVVQLCAEEGMLMHPNIVNACAVMTSDQVVRSCDILRNVLKRIKDMSNAEVEASLVVPPYEDSARR